MQAKVDTLERADRDGAADRGTLDQTDFDSFFNRNLLKQKCTKCVLGLIFCNNDFVFRRTCSEHWKRPKDEAQPPSEGADQQNRVELQGAKHHLLAGQRVQRAP